MEQAVNTSTSQEQLLTKKEVALYGMGGIAGLMADQLKGTFHLAFLSDVAGVPVAVAGIISMLMTIWDAINDPIIGRITDKTQTRYGKYRPHLIMGSIGTTITVIAMFLLPNMSTTLRTIYYTIALALYSVFFTQFVVSLQALNTVISPSSAQRNTLLSARLFAGSISGAVVSIITVSVVAKVNAATGVNAGYPVVATFVGIVTIACGFLCAAGVKKKDYAGSLPTPPPLRFKEQLNLIFKNKAMIFICLAFGMIALNYALANAVTVYYLRLVVNDLSVLATLSMIYLVMSLVTIPLIPTLIKKFHKVPLTMIGVAITILPSFALYILGTKATSLEVIVITLVGLFGFTIANMTCLAIIPDVVDYTEYHFGSVQAGFISAIANFFRKFFSAFSTFIVGMLLGIAGYNAQVAPSEAVINQIMNIKTTVPIIIGIVCLIMLKLYPVTHKVQVELQENLKIRRMQTNNN